MIFRICYNTIKYLGVKNWFKNLCQKFDTQIVILNNKATSPQRKLVKDLISIIHSCI